jgi:O-antigen/teichoic acid export membrane protein
VWGQLLVMELLLQVVQRRMEFLFLQAYSTEVQLAMYSIGFMVVSTAAILPMSLVEAGLPGVAESLGAGTIDRTSRMLGSALRIVSVASLPLTAAVVCLGPVLILVLYGSDYQLAADLVPLMGLSLILVTSGNLCATFWIGADRLRLPIIGASVGAVVDLSLAWLLVGDHGAWGAAIANLAGQTTMAVIMLVLTWRTAGRFPVMAGRWLGVLLYSAVVSAVVLAVIGAIGTGSGAAAVMALIAGVVLFIVLMLALGATAGFVHGADAAWLHEALPNKLRRWAWLFTGRRTREQG